MDNEKYLYINIHQIQLFLCVFEQRSFTKAALLNDMEQSTVSRYISGLEEVLDTQLFQRDIRPIRPTLQAEILYKKWKPLMDSFISSIDEIEAHSRVSIYTLDYLSFIAEIPELRNYLTSCFGKDMVDISYTSFENWEQLLADGSADIVITIENDYVSRNDSFIYEELTRYANKVCMLKTNPLSAKSSIEYSDLIDQKLITIDPRIRPNINTTLNGMFEKMAGFTPTIYKTFPSPLTFTSALENDDEVVFCGDFIRESPSPLVKFFDLPGSFTSLCAITKKEHVSNNVTKVIRALKKYFNTAK